MDDIALLASAQLDAHRVDQNQAVELGRPDNRHLGGDPSAERKADHSDPVVWNALQHVQIKADEIVHRVEIRGPGRIAEARMRWRYDLAMLGEKIEKRRLEADVVDAVEQQDRTAAGASPGAAQQLELETANRDAASS